MRTRHSLAIALLVAASGCSTTTTTTPPRPSYPVPTATLTATASITLSANQATAVRNYYAGLSSSNTRGRRGLPPGIARNLERGKALPPGIAKNYLPGDLAARLPPLPSGLEYVITAGKLLLVEAATQVVREVLLDIAFD
ncbi:MAG TPA: hypothetical protein VGC50_11080 [Gammaproteobacteria bacterium]|jgi:uncharacterized protein YceK